MLIPMYRWRLFVLVQRGSFAAFFRTLNYKKAFEWVEIFFRPLTIAGIYVIFDFHPQYKTGIIFGIISAMGSALFQCLIKMVVRFQPNTVVLAKWSAAY